MRPADESEVVEVKGRGRMNRAFTDFQDETVRWHGLSGVYSLAESAIMRRLEPRERMIVHHLKALFGGEILEPDDLSLDLIAPGKSLVVSGKEKGPVPVPRKRRNEPLPGQTSMAD